jgi:hypothetical protein
VALYQPLIVYPALDETVDATSSAVTFYVKVRGTQCIKYAIYIYDVATNTEQYTNTVTLGSTLYDGDQLNIDVDISALGADEYYWKVHLYWTATDYIASQYYTFNASTPPTIAFVPVVPTTITTPSYTFIGTYSQAEGVDVKYFQIDIYNAGVIVASSGQITSTPNNIRFTVNGLISGESYQVQISGMTQQNVSFATSLTSFNVAYTVPVSRANPSATLNDDSSVTVNWGNIVSITGVITGSSSYESDYLYAGNYGLNLAAGADVQFDLDFTPPFTKEWIVTFPVGFSGVFGEIEDTAGVNYIYFGYDGSKFYINVNGDYFYDSPEVLTTNPYVVGVVHDGINIALYAREVA